ncbi:hypothetical protein GGR51DRAFT_168217 [Nemania sp. FL0031]|nr:hypothetical protein GGR51DRAFT_168217 [Nemania sp. FL0031]
MIRILSKWMWMLYVCMLDNTSMFIHYFGNCDQRKTGQVWQAPAYMKMARSTCVPIVKNFWFLAKQPLIALNLPQTSPRYLFPLVSILVFYCSAYMLPLPLRRCLIIRGQFDYKTVSSSLHTLCVLWLSIIVSVGSRCKGYRRGLPLVAVKPLPLSPREASQHTSFLLLDRHDRFPLASHIAIAYVIGSPQPLNLNRTPRRRKSFIESQWPHTHNILRASCRG